MLQLEVLLPMLIYLHTTTFLLREIFIKKDVNGQKCGTNFKKNKMPKKNNIEIAILNDRNLQENIIRGKII